jgi:SpoVK/Ycf46/Vps4 family AAA+-type ATPase
MLLSALGGITRIPNILVFGSTNFLYKIDLAILRRFTPYYYVGFPTKKERKQILSTHLKTLNDWT